MLRRGKLNRVFDRYFSRIFVYIRRRRWQALILVVLLTVLATLSLRLVPFDNNVEAMLPGDSQVMRTMRFLKESHFSDKAIISFKLNNNHRTYTDLIQAVENFKSDLDPKFIKSVIGGISQDSLSQDLVAFAKYVPRLIDQNSLWSIEKKLTPQNVEQNLARNYRALLNPGSSFMLPLVRSDPLGITYNYFRALLKLSSSLGYEVKFESGHFLSRDGRAAMLILQTRVPITDGFGSRKLLNYLQSKIKALPDFVFADIIAGHRHTVSNEDIIKKDIGITLVIATIAFLMVFLFGFKDIKAVFLFLTPLAVVPVAIVITYLVFRELSYFIIGMGGVIIGIADDYGIHIYMSVRKNPKDKKEAARIVAKPMIASAILTVTVFCAFFFSKVKGYHQLALFSIVSLILTFIYALFILPQFITPKKLPDFPIAKKLSPNFGKHKNSKSADITRLVIWAIFLILGMASSVNVKFTSDIRRFDGSSPEIIRSEDQFYKTWSTKERTGFLVVSGNNLEEALRKNEELYRQAIKKIGEDNFVSIASVLPSRRTGDANALRWQSFWQGDRKKNLEKLVISKGLNYHFNRDTFKPFFDSLGPVNLSQDNLEKVEFFQQLKDRFIVKSDNGYSVLSFFPDSKDYVTSLSSVSDNFTGAFLVSQKSFAASLSRAVVAEVIRLCAIAILLIVVVTFLLLRDLRLTFIALVTVVSGIFGMLGIIAATGISLNAPAIVAATIIIGLCIDYGMFMVFACREKIEEDTRLSLFVSVFTTIIGCAVLLFAQHPVLFAIGVTLVTGLISAYLASLFVIPSLYRLWVSKDYSLE
jgi:predicted exporter